jgi:hypothetical protein
MIDDCSILYMITERLIPYWLCYMKRLKKKRIDIFFRLMELMNLSTSLQTLCKEEKGEAGHVNSP